MQEAQDGSEGGGVTFYNTIMANLLGWTTTNNIASLSNTYDSCDL